MKKLFFALLLLTLVPTVQAQWGYSYYGPYNWYQTPVWPPPGSAWYSVPRIPYIAPPLYYTTPAPVYVQPPVIIQPKSELEAPAGYRWKNIWDNKCRCNRAVLIAN